MTEFDWAVLRGSALIEAYRDLTGIKDPTAEDLITDVLAWKFCDAEVAA